MFARFLESFPKRTGLKVLHIAPEASIAGLVRKLVPDVSYTAADLQPKDETVLRQDLTSMTFPDDSFDWIICFHVLEHIEDDMRALSEMRRVLRPGGTAFLMVPAVEGLEQTYENPAIRLPEERILHFGQADHVRQYGRDIQDRIRAAGLRPSTYLATPEECAVHRLSVGEKLFLGTKPEG